jgi:hypothetical protein
LLAVAATITVIEWVVRREARERLRPRSERALHWIGLELQNFTTAVLLDYAETHLANYRPIPDDVVEMLKQWRMDHDFEDVPRTDIDDGAAGKAPLIVLEAVMLARGLDQARSRDLDILEPVLVREIDDFGDAARNALQLCTTSQAEWNETGDDSRGTAADVIVRGFQRLVEVFFELDSSNRWRAISDLSRRGIDAHHSRLVDGSEQ